MEELHPHVGHFHPAIGSILIPFPGTAIYEAYRDRFGFDAWWLGEERSFDVPRPVTHAYFEHVLFRNGAILDADFFRYSSEVRTKIIDVFKFMYFSNLRSHSFLSRTIQWLAFSASLLLSRRWPRAERWLFRLPITAVQAMRHRRQPRGAASSKSVPQEA
jgi:hypothetical protein